MYGLFHGSQTFVVKIALLNIQKSTNNEPDAAIGYTAVIQFTELNVEIISEHIR
jgi:hypothetical protein